MKVQSQVRRTLKYTYYIKVQWHVRRTLKYTYYINIQWHLPRTLKYKTLYYKYMKVQSQERLTLKYTYYMYMTDSGMYPRTLKYTNYMKVQWHVRHTLKYKFYMYMTVQSHVRPTLKYSVHISSKTRKNIKILDALLKSPLLMWVFTVNLEILAWGWFLHFSQYWIFHANFPHTRKQNPHCFIKEMRVVSWKYNPFMKGLTKIFAKFFPNKNNQVYSMFT